MFKYAFSKLILWQEKKYLPVITAILKVLRFPKAQEFHSILAGEC